MRRVGGKCAPADLADESGGVAVTPRLGRRADGAQANHARDGWAGSGYRDDPVVILDEQSPVTQTTGRAGLRIRCRHAGVAAEGARPLDHQVAIRSPRRAGAPGWRACGVLDGASQ
jgi:hypothetical protein